MAGFPPWIRHCYPGLSLRTSASSIRRCSLVWQCNTELRGSYRSWCIWHKWLICILAQVGIYPSSPCEQDLCTPFSANTYYILLHNLYKMNLYLVITNREHLQHNPELCTWWRIGRVKTFRPECRGFESSRHVRTLGKSFTRSSLWRFGIKLRHSIRAVSGALLSSSGLEETL